jgi:hypothetical protein
MNVLLNFFALTPKRWKSGLIYCLLHRAKTICANNNMFNNEVIKLREMFSKNSYPSRFFDFILNRFISRQSSDQHEIDSEEEIIDLDKPDTILLNVPYFGKCSEKFGKKLSAIFENKFGLNVVIVYSTFKIGSYFKLKSCTPLELVSNVVYLFTCVRDARTSYIGMTSQHLITRVNEHTIKPNRKSEVKNHILHCQTCQNHKITIKNFKPIKHCRDDFETKIFEALIIKKRRPNLNKQLFAQGAGYLLRVFR